MLDYVALVRPAPAGREHHNGLVRKIEEKAADLAKIDVPGATVFAGKTQAIKSSADGRCVIIGDIFAGGEEGAPIGSAAIDFDRARASGGRSLFESHWGGYVAIIADLAGDRSYILRDPSGALACYYVLIDDELIITSSVRRLAEAGIISGTIDQRSMLRHLIVKDLRLAETCLEGVTELLRGLRLSLQGRRLGREVLWSPWVFAEQCKDFGTAAEAALSLRKTVQSAVSAWAARYSHIVLGVSGGLDSSIVAACIRQGATALSCITLATDDPLGDERDYARILTEALHVDLIEEREQVEAVDIQTSDASHLPRPIARAFAQSGDRKQLSLARRVGADAFFSGGGGDNVFCFLPSTGPFVDRLGVEGLGWGVVETARDLARMTGSSVLEVMGKGLRRALFRSPAYRWPVDMSFLPADALEAVGEVEPHPWQKPPGGMQPGKATHVAWLMGIENHLEGFHRERTHPFIAPLLSQPVVELCLRIPTWMWCAGGRNRAVARDAFHDLLPPAILDRQSKGTPGPFVFQIFEANRDEIREMLLDGYLAREALIDRSGVEDLLSREGPLGELENARIMLLVDVEAWARSWAS